MQKLVIIILFSIIISLFFIACFSQPGYAGKKLYPYQEQAVPVISGSTVIQKPYTLYVQESGLFGLLYNSDTPLFTDAGLEFFDNKKTQNFADLTAKKQITNRNSIINLGKHAAAAGDFSQQIHADGRDIVFTYDFPQEFAAAFEYCNVAIHFPQKNLQQAAYTANGRLAQFPGAYKALILAEKLFSLELHFAGVSLGFRSARPFALYDGRAWKSGVFSVVFDLKHNKPPLEFRLTLPQDVPSPVLVKENKLRYSRLGYAAASPKFAFLESPAAVPAGAGAPVMVVDETGRTVLEGQFGSSFTAYQFHYAGFDFSALTRPGRYKLTWAGGESDYFPVSNSVFDNIWQDALDIYLPFQMCHITLNGTGALLSRPACHLDDGVCVPEGIAELDGYIAYPRAGQGPPAGRYIPCGTGGWHDAGDYDLPAATQALTVHHLVLAYEEFKIMHDKATLHLETQTFTTGISDGIPDILQQAAWGVLWLLSMQDPDGHFYIGVIEREAMYKPDIPPGKTSDGILTNGDERYVYPDYQSAEHTKAVAALAAAARVLNDFFPELAARCLKAARAGFKYFENHEEVYHLQTSFITDVLSRPGRDQTLIAAAAELFLTTADARYMEIIQREVPGLAAAVYQYPEPDQTTRLNYIFAAPYLARVYHLMQPGDAKNRVKDYLQEIMARKKYLQDFANWPFTVMVNPWYGLSGFPLRLVFDLYYLERVFPDKVHTTDGLTCLYWLLGLHPLNAQVYITGLHPDQPQHMYSGILTAAYGDEPHTVPGAVIPGLCTIADRAVFLDDYHEYKFTEPITDVSATLIFAAHAMKAALAGEDNTCP